MGYSRKIKPVSTLADKHLTYTALCGNRTRAVKYGFYIESMHISYAILEDRTRSFFYHLGYLQSREEFCKCSRKTNDFFTEVFQSYVKSHNLEKKNKTINGFSNKLLLIRAVWEFTNNNDTCTSISTQYFSLLKQRLEKIEDIYILLDKIDEWRECRNEVTHALANKTLLDLQEKLEEISNQGITLSKAFDNIVKIIKKDKKLRFYLKMKD